MRKEGWTDERGLSLSNKKDRRVMGYFYFQLEPKKKLEMKPNFISNQLSSSSPSLIVSIYNCNYSETIP